MMQDLTPGDRKKLLWREAGWAIIAAVDRGGATAVSKATECLIAALDSEGWMTPQRTLADQNPLQACLAALSADLSVCIAAAGKPKPRPVLRMVESSRRPSPGGSGRKAAQIRPAPAHPPVRIGRTG